MTIAILGTPNTAIDVETATVSYTAETGTNRLLVALPTAEASGSRTLTSLSYGGTNGVIAAGRNSILPASLVYWLNANIAAGANDFAVTWSAFMSGGNGQSAAFTFSNVDQTNPLRNAAEAFGSGSPTAQNAEPGDMAVLLVANTATNVRYAVSGYTEHYDANRGGDHSVAIYTKAITTSGSEAPSITGGAWTDGVFMVLRVASAGSAPTISSVTPTTFANGQTGIVITGTGFGATQGAGSVRIGTSSSNPATGAVTQTVTAWSDTSITITAVRGSLATLTNHFLFVTNNGGTSNATGFPVSFGASAAQLIAAPRRQVFVIDKTIQH